MKTQARAMLTTLALMVCVLPSTSIAESIFGKITDDELLSLFLIRSVGVTDTRDLNPSAVATIVKWDRPPRFLVVSKDAELASFFAEKVVRPLLVTFIESTNVTATVSNSDDGANILAIIGENPSEDLGTFAPDLLRMMGGDQSKLDKLKEMIRQKPRNCFVKPYIVDRKLVNAVIFVPKPNSALFASAKCFGSSAAMALGLLGPDDETDTVKNRTDPSTSFTPSDQAALRILYDRRVPSLIKIEELAPIVSALNKELGASE